MNHREADTKRGKHDESGLNHVVDSCKQYCTCDIFVYLHNISSVHSATGCVRSTAAKTILTLKSILVTIGID